MAFPNLGALPMIPKFVPFALSFAANALVKTTMRYTDMRFTLLGLVVEVIVTVMLVNLAAQLLKCYVTDFLVSNLTFGLWLMVPIYLFDFFNEAVTASPAPLWFEAVAYVIVVVVIILLTLAMFGQDLVAAFQSEKERETQRTEGDS